MNAQQEMQQKTKDNILLITTDQQRFDTINAWGNQSIFTPHLNYMAAMGTSFTGCYASCPICVPSRTTIMTGIEGYESGVVSNADHRAFMEARTAKRLTLPAMLTDAGYQTCAKGKMHFEPARACYGFEHMTLPLDYMRACDKRGDRVRPKVHGIGECLMEPVISTVEARDSMTTWIGDEAIDFIETRDPLRPFFLWTSFTKPHPPFDPCRDFWELYQQISMPEPVYGDWSHSLEDTPQGFLAGSYENTDMHLFGPEQIAASRRAYYACITQVDYQLGRLFGALREHGLFENTWILFTSDHGEMLGDHYMSQKNLFFEGSAHVPFILVPPAGRAIPHNNQVDGVITLADVFPTILAMAGLTPPEDGSGENLLPFLSGKGQKEKRFYGDSLHTNFCVMEDRKKLIYTRIGSSMLLFDLEKDPMERHNLADDPKYREVRERLWNLLISHVKKTAPQVLKPGSGTDNSDTFISIPAPRFPGDMPGRWLGFHYHDYTVDTFH